MARQYRRAENILFRQLPAEVLIAPHGRNDFDRLDGAAVPLWELLESPRTVGDLVDIFTDLYSAPAPVIEKDLTAILFELVDRNYLESFE